MLLPFNGHVITSETTGPPELQEISFDELPPELAESMGFHGTPVMLTGEEGEEAPPPEGAAEPGEDDEPTLSKLDDGRAEVDGRFRIDELNEELELELPEEEEYDTVAGFLLAKFGRVPEEGEELESHGARFTVLEATPTHIRRIGVELLEPAAVNGNGESGGAK